MTNGLFPLTMCEGGGDAIFGPYPVSVCVVRGVGVALLSERYFPNRLTDSFHFYSAGILALEILIS